MHTPQFGQQRDPLARADELFRAGRVREAQALYQQISRAQPGNVRPLHALAVLAVGQGDRAAARKWFRKAIDVAPREPALLADLASLHLQDNEHEQALKLLDRALEVQPEFFPAKIYRGHVLEQLGRQREAALAYSEGLTEAGSPDRIPPEMRQLAEHARGVVMRYREQLQRYVESRLSGLKQRHGEASLARIDEALGIRMGHLKRMPQAPRATFMPGMSERTFYEREEFPWLAEVEARTDDIRQEFLKVLEEDVGFDVYLSRTHGLGADQTRDLQSKVRWSAYHFFRDGERYEENCARCPITASVLQKIPLPSIPGKSPEAFYSLLQPGGHIMPHHGPTNTRLVIHLPLIVPESCGIRVGNATREWVEGECLIFDDSIEHEAWNRSDKLRVVFIFETWAPGLSDAEKEGIGTMVGALEEFDPDKTPLADD